MRLNNAYSYRSGKMENGTHSKLAPAPHDLGFIFILLKNKKKMRKRTSVSLHFCKCVRQRDDFF